MVTTNSKEEAVEAFNLIARTNKAPMRMKVKRNEVLVMVRKADMYKFTIYDFSCGLNVS